MFWKLLVYKGGKYYLKGHLDFSQIANRRRMGTRPRRKTNLPSCTTDSELLISPCDKRFQLLPICLTGLPALYTVAQLYWYTTWSISKLKVGEGTVKACFWRKMVKAGQPQLTIYGFCFLHIGYATAFHLRQLGAELTWTQFFMQSVINLSFWRSCVRFTMRKHQAIASKLQK